MKKNIFLLVFIGILIFFTGCTKIDSDAKKNLHVNKQTKLNEDTKEYRIVDLIENDDDYYLFLSIDLSNKNNDEISSSYTLEKIFLGKKVPQANNLITLHFKKGTFTEQKTAPSIIHGELLKVSFPK